MNATDEPVESGRNGVGRLAELPQPGNNWQPGESPESAFSLSALSSWVCNGSLGGTHLARHYLDGEKEP